VGGGVASIIEGIAPTKVNDTDILKKQAEERSRQE